ncbi:unnamed protein product [Didymodactylos carnosus]|uniref:NHL repeat-containing protein n=1 Tax=Didymodactylos carnosus TaxID=1234261 RepID=A0A814RZQ3_9BILA|nr:unnamed protein product [Didymodactylos carnosus]CAF3902319.1 unnamed protein product [Didymodactylos carnosus]
MSATASFLERQWLATKSAGNVVNYNFKPEYIVQHGSKFVKPLRAWSTFSVRSDAQSSLDKGQKSPLSQNSCVTRGTTAIRKFICSQPFKYGFIGFLLASVLNAAVFGTLLGLCLKSTATVCVPTTWSENGTTVAGGNGVGSNLNQLNNPAGIFVDKNKNIYITDIYNDRLVEWSNNATVGVVVGGGNGGSDNVNQLWEPAYVTVTNDGSIFVADRQNNRIQKLSPEHNHRRVLIDCHPSGTTIPVSPKSP